jgi:hypothetical protein
MRVKRRVYDVELKTTLTGDAARRFGDALIATTSPVITRGGAAGVTWALPTRRVDEHAAVDHAEAVVAAAARLTGIAVPAITGIRSRLQNLTGCPRRVATPPGRYEAVDLGDGDRLLAMSEGPLGDWVVHLESAPDRAWTGRDLGGVLRRVLAVPFGRRDAGVARAVEALAGHQMPLGVRYACPCCDCLTLPELPSGSFRDCPVCRWEDDRIQFLDLDHWGGANRPSLREARENYRRLGASDPRRLELVRPPIAAEIP